MSRHQRKTFRGGALLQRDKFDYPSRVKAYMRKNPDTQIVKFTLARMPIASGLKKFINILSFGKIQENMKRMAYDELYHLSMEMQLSNGDFLRVEKAQVILMHRYNENRSDSTHVNGAGIVDFIREKMDEGNKTDFKMITERLEVPLSQSINFVEFFERARTLVGDEKFFTYSAITNNCQSFLSGCLKANGLYSDTVRKFVVQSAKALVKDTPWVESIMQNITNAAALIDSLIH